ncbi:MAG TPA: YqaA family protein [Castellaniella sp.]|jgi:membrane protein YqaA with SNARE-associated domain|nr:YqaA family protein [Castellaniella sp.]
METWLQPSIHALLAALALPRYGLSAIFLVSLVSATLLPLGSEPAVFGYVHIAPHMFWPAVGVATLGNTLGGAVTYAMGAGAESLWHRWHHPHPAPARGSAGGRWHAMTTDWFHRFGPPALLLSWLPVIGDPLCAVAGWLRLPFWPSLFYMAIGKFLRYAVLTGVLIHTWPWVRAWL